MQLERAPRTNIAKHCFKRHLKTHYFNIDLTPPRFALPYFYFADSVTPGGPARSIGRAVNNLNQEA